MSRTRNKIKMSVVLGGLSGLSLATAGSAWAFSLLVLAGAVLALREVFEILTRPGDLTAFRALAVTFFAGYFLGPSLSIATWYLAAGANPVLLAGPFAYHGYSPSLSLAVALAYAAIAVLLVADHGARPLAALNFDRQHFEPMDLVFLVALAALVMSALVTGELGYMGTQVSANNTVSLLGSLGGTVLPAMVPVSIAAILDKPAGKVRRIVFLAVLTSMCVILVIQGRRVLIFAALTTMIVVRLHRPRARGALGASGSRAGRKSTLLAAIASVFLLLGLYYFSAFRLATQQWGQDTTLDVRTMVAAQILSQNQYGFIRFASAQAAARSGTLPGYLAALLRSNTGGRLSGECLVANTITAVPRSLLAQKSYLSSKYSCTDEHLNAAYGLPQIDSPTTLLTQGYADFGWLGAILYPLLIGALMQLALRMARLPSIQSIRGFIVSAILFQSLFVEQSLSAYLVTVRNLGIIVSIGFTLWIVSAVPIRIATPRT